MKKTEPTRPKNMEEVIAIFEEAAREYFREHPEEIENLANQQLLTDLRKYAGLKQKEINNDTL